MEKQKINEQPELNGDRNESLELPEKDNGEDNASKLRGYKTVCAKLGLSMCVYFIFRLLGGLISIQFSRFSDVMGESLYSLANTMIMIIMVYVIPLFITALIFKSFSNYKGKYRELYQKPKRFARAMGTFPATFGFGHGIALLTMLVMYLISRNLSGHSYLEELLQPTVMESSSNLVSILALVFLMVIIAPLFEEFWVRGIMYDALKPYGTGMAIIISSLLFGFMHGSLYMLFYTTAYGLALGYIRYATNSLLVVTILHAIVNSLGAGALLLSTLMQITNEENRYINTVFIIYLLAFLVLIIVGVAVFLSKIRSIRKYKIENSWTTTGPWKKAALFFASIPVILMMVLAFNELTQGLLVGLIFN